MRLECEHHQGGLGAGERKPCVGLSGVNMTDPPGREAHPRSKLRAQPPRTRYCIAWPPAVGACRSDIGQQAKYDTAAACIVSNPRLAGRFIHRPHAPIISRTTYPASCDITLSRLCKSHRPTKNGDHSFSDQQHPRSRPITRTRRPPSKWSTGLG